MHRGTHVLDPGSATLRVLTHRQGIAAKAGHDLVIEVGRWEATLVLGDEPSLELTADPRSLEIRQGLGGAKPLSDRDRREIRKNIDQKVLGGAPIRFNSTAIDAGDDGRLQVSGRLEMAGAEAPAAFDLQVGDDGTVAARTTVAQTRWGIKPYSGLMGALKVADDVHVEVEGRLPGV